MEVKINREIRNYTESMFFGLSLRQFIFSVLACGVAVGLYFLLRPYVGTETVSWVCILGAAPFAALGYVLLKGQKSSTLTYMIYCMSAYCLTIWILPLPRLFRKAKANTMYRGHGK